MILIFWKHPNYSLYIQGTKYCGNICFRKIPHTECANFSNAICFPVNWFKSHTILLAGWYRTSHLTSPFVCLVDLHQLWWHIWIMQNCLNLGKWLQAHRTPICCLYMDPRPSILLFCLGSFHECNPCQPHPEFQPHPGLGIFAKGTGTNI